MGPPRQSSSSKGVAGDERGPIEANKDGATNDHKETVGRIVLLEGAVAREEHSKRGAWEGSGGHFGETPASRGRTSERVSVASPTSTLGGTAGIKAALADRRLDSRSGFLDFTKAYWEGVLNGVTFGGANEYWQSRADRKSVIDSLSMGLLRFGEGVFAVDEYKVLTDPKTNEYEKATAFFSMVAKYAGLGAGGKTLQERIAARGAGRTQAAGPAEAGGHHRHPGADGERSATSADD
jgi:hypothetical protein